MKVSVIKTNRKALAIQVNPDLSVTVRTPKSATDRDIDKILKEKEAWIQKHIQDIQRKKAEYEAPEVVNYVIVHELCHRKEMNHSKDFWSEVKKILPDYKQSVQWLKEEGGYIMRRGR